MRIWSLHPKYLDAKGLVALWRETLLAKHVLEGKTKGYTNHPQLDRFKKLKNPAKGIHQYLAEVHREALARGYNFDKSKFKAPALKVKMKVNDGQLKYETKHLMRKLKIRDQKKYLELQRVKTFETHPMFRKVPGNIENWEII